MSSPSAKVPAGHLNAKSQHMSLMKPQSSSPPDLLRALRSTAWICAKSIEANAVLRAIVFNIISLIKLLI